MQEICDSNERSLSALEYEVRELRREFYGCEGLSGIREDVRGLRELLLELRDRVFARYPGPATPSSD